ncbi:hypothetical protein NHX12_029802 [Muraenolepis orangiensis]|uniref:Protein-arginine deiminase n=1 Tax=Muraenolepis orangiensis TaxID=630683 RepID=A0A9Q0ECP3_9TELE|nr:hypothetical protein NHX12_029802 [Muraenolepis orangiensis]
MSRERTLRVDCGKTSQVVYVVGTTLSLDLCRSAPPKSKSFQVQCFPNIQFSISPVPAERTSPSPLPLDTNTLLFISMEEASLSVFDRKLSVTYYGDNTEVLGKAVLHLTAIGRPVNPYASLCTTSSNGRNMTKVIQDFLWAQKVQEPVAIYSDWLLVGHVDEFMTFVPAPGPKGFRLLLASPDAGYKLFKRLQDDGHGEAKMFDGQGKEEEMTVNALLDDEMLKHQNDYVQGCIDWNRDVLKKELGLDGDDIIDLPVLFKMQYDHAIAFYPDMVNMIVLGKELGIPKPFGPKIRGCCALEAEMTALMEPLGLNCNYIDNFTSYHKLQGEVHCGSNVRRDPFALKWWNLEM